MTEKEKEKKRGRFDGEAIRETVSDDILLLVVVLVLTPSFLSSNYALTQQQGDPWELS